MAWRLSPRTVSGSRVEENQESLLLRCPPRWNFVALGGKTIGQAIFFRHGCHFYGIRTLFHKDVQGDLDTQFRTYWVWNWVFLLWKKLWKLGRD